MGASGWEYRVPFGAGIDDALIRAQHEVLASGDHIWPWDALAAGSDETVGRPATLEELAAAKQNEEFWEEGTHTILDVDRVVSPDEQSDFAAIRPLTSDELLAIFETVEPDADDFDRVREPGPSGSLEDCLGEKWSGRCLVIHQGGAPAEVVFWGWSGD